MMHYKDRSFCVAKCKKKDCPIRLTNEIQAEARELKMDVAVIDQSTICDEFIPEDET